MTCCLDEAEKLCLGFGISEISTVVD
jgi:hypothetical protein